MVMTARTRAELERRGARNVARLLEGNLLVGHGPSAMVPIGLPDENPSRTEVEAWLREQEEVAGALLARRHEEQLAVGKESARWAKLAYYAAIASIIITILCALLPLLTGR